MKSNLLFTIKFVLSNILFLESFGESNENIDMDVTDYVNGLLTGDTNYGLGIAYDRSYELMNTNCLQYVGFFTNNTQIIIRNILLYRFTR